MKLRLFVFVLLLANVVFGVWSLGWLDTVFGITARTDREPHRVLQQVKPQLMTIVTPAAESGATSRTPARPIGPPTPAPTPTPTATESPVRTAAASAPGVMPALGAPSPSSPGLAASGGVSVCVEATGLTAAQADTAEKSLASLPTTAWRRVAVETPASLAAAMGPFPTREALRSKVAELERLKIPFERVPQPNPDGSAAASAPTLLVLSRTPTRAAAEEILRGLAQRGVRTGRVITLSPAGTFHRLIVEGANEAQAQALKAAGTGVDGKSFESCAA